MKKPECQLNRIAVGIDRLNQNMTEVIDLSQKRLDVHSTDIYALHERIRAMEEYLKVEIKGSPVIKKKYIKIK